MKVDIQFDKKKVEAAIRNYYDDSNGAPSIRYAIGTFILKGAEGMEKLPVHKVEIEHVGQAYLIAWYYHTDEHELTRCVGKVVARYEQHLKTYMISNIA